MPDEDKVKRISMAEAHLKASKCQRDYYNEQCMQAKNEHDSYREV